MFRPPSIFHAGRKASELRRHLATAGRPISRDAAQGILAIVWGWTSWSELSAALDAPGEPSPFDEDLIGPVARRSVLHRRYRRVVARRNVVASITIRRELGLPLELAVSLCAIVRFTGGHEPNPEASERALSVRRINRRPAPSEGPSSMEVWLTADQLREELRLFDQPPPPEWQELLRDLTAARIKRPGLPPHRPR
jgi:hypothetical protein